MPHLPADRDLSEPHPTRLPLDHPARDRILAAHQAAMERGADGYLDPVSGLYVFTAAYLARRRRCCSTACRHCPYV